MRAFIAVELTADLRSGLGHIQDRLKKSGADIKWVKPENIHLTLKFLGNVVESGLEPLGGELREIASRFSPFRIRFNGLGVFPNLRNPRVVWIGVNPQSRELLALQRAIEENLLKLQFASEEREYKSHLTLGRVRSARNKGELVKIIESLDSSLQEIGEMEVAKVSLIRSELRKPGPVYTVLEQMDLRRN